MFRLAATAAAAAASVRAASVRGMASLSRSTPPGTAFDDLDFGHLSGAPSAASPTSLSCSEASFSLRSTGLGTLLQVSLPPGGSVCAPPGRLIGHSPSAVAELAVTTSELGVVAAASRVLSGAPFVLSTLSAPFDEPADALLAPPRLADVALIELDGFARYCVAPGSLLAATQGVRLNPWTGLGRAGKARLAHATGRGLVAISAYGGLLGLKLDKGESYVVRASHVVAWDDRVSISRSSSASTADKEDVAAGDDALKSGKRHASLAARLGNIVKSTFSSAGSIPFVTVTGPGQVYLNSRVPPTFSRWLNSRKSSRPDSADSTAPAPPPAASAAAPAAAASAAAPAAASAAAPAAAASDAATAAEPAEDKPRSRFDGVFGSNK